MTQKQKTKTKAIKIIDDDDPMYAGAYAIDLESLDDQDKKLVANGKTHNMTKAELVKATDDVIRELAKAILLEEADTECDDIDETHHKDIVDVLFDNCETEFWQWCIQDGCPIHRSGIENVVAQTYWNWSEAVTECEHLWIMDDDDDE